MTRTMLPRQGTHECPVCSVAGCLQEHDEPTAPWDPWLVAGGDYDPDEDAPEPSWRGSSPDLHAPYSRLRLYPGD